MYKTTFTILILIILAGCGERSAKTINEIVQGKEIISDSGMVVSAHPQSSLIGARILQMGGNAIDAAVATEFALSVCYPEAGNIGGGGFMLIRTVDGKADVIDYREKAPMRASRDMYLDNKGIVTAGLSTGTHLASGVPGTVAGMILCTLKTRETAVQRGNSTSYRYCRKRIFSDQPASPGFKFVEESLHGKKLLQTSLCKGFCMENRRYSRSKVIG